MCFTDYVKEKDIARSLGYAIFLIQIAPYTINTLQIGNFYSW